MQKLLFTICFIIAFSHFGLAQAAPVGYVCPSAFTVYQNGCMKVCFSDTSKFSLHFGGISYENFTTSFSGSFITYFHGENNPVVGSPTCQWYSPDPNNLICTGNSVLYSIPPTFINNYNVFNVGSVVCAFILPIHVLSFNAKAEAGHTSLLSWEAVQTGSYFWHILERSADGIIFKEISREKIPQSSGQNIVRNSTDHPPAGNTFYYRLRMESPDGSFEYSEIKMVVFNDKDSLGISIYPNPVTDLLQIIQTNGQTGSYHLFDNTGRMIKTGLLNGSSQSIPMSSLPSGMYVLEIKSTNGAKSFKVVKE